MNAGAKLWPLFLNWIPELFDYVKKLEPECMGREYQPALGPNHNAQEWPRTLVYVVWVASCWSASEVTIITWSCVHKAEMSKICNVSWILLYFCYHLSLSVESLDDNIILRLSPTVFGVTWTLFPLFPL